MAALFELENAGFAYPGGKELFQRLNLKILSTDSILLTGENGSGKSTLLKLLTGLLLPAQGTARFKGKPLTKAAVQTFRDLSFFLQNPRENLFGLCPRHDLQIWLMARPRQLDAAAGDAIARRHEGLWNRPYTELSDGEVRAVVQSVLPWLTDDFWILDEPFAGLDKDRRRELLQILHRKMEGMLIVSHDNAELKGICNRVLRLEKGRLIEER